jgi:acetylornithine deacetylase
MVRHKSYSQSEGERELARFMAERMGELGLEAGLQPVEVERVNAIGRWRGQGGAKSLLFNGHVDTNPVTEGWTVDPWGGLVDDRFIYGIGVSNMKAGDAAYFWAVKTLVDAGVKLAGDVILSFVVGELQGGVGTLAMLRHGVCGRTISSTPSQRICRPSPCTPPPSPSSSSSSASRVTCRSARRRSTRSWPAAT